MIDNAVKYVNDNDSSTRVQARENALNAYHVSVRGTNTGNANANANAETNLTNTQASAANSVANTKLQTENATYNTNLSNTASTDITNLNNTKLDADVVTSNFKLGADKSVDKLMTPPHMKPTLNRRCYQTYHRRSTPLRARQSP